MAWRGVGVEVGVAGDTQLLVVGGCDVWLGNAARADTRVPRRVAVRESF